MGNRKAILINATVALVVVGLIGMTYPFLASLRPSAKARANIPDIRVSNLAVGKITEVKQPQKPGSVFFVRVSQHEIKAFEAAYLSDYSVYWIWAGDHWCDEFDYRDSMIVCIRNGRIQTAWDLDGRADDEYSSNLKFIPVKVRGAHLAWGDGASS